MFEGVTLVGFLENGIRHESTLCKSKNSGGYFYFGKPALSGSFA